jgi:hypothetical protein
MLIRFNYCPPNPGPNSKPRCRWYSDVRTAIDAYDGKSSIWLRTGKGKYIEISYNKLLELV